jgi:hypothetical protein
MFRLILLLPLALPISACSTVEHEDKQVRHNPLTVVELRISTKDRQKGTILIKDRARLRTESHPINISTGYLVTPDEYKFLVDSGKLSQE